MSIFGKIFTWWNGATIGTAIFTSRKGEEVGTDAAGNRYYRSKNVKDGQRERRWVIYDGANDASRDRDHCVLRCNSRSAFAGDGH